MGYENRVASNSTIIRTTMNHSSKIGDSVQDKNLTQTILGFSYFRCYTFLVRTLKMTEQTENDSGIQIHKYQHSNTSVLPYFLLLAQNWLFSDFLKI